MAWFSDFGGTFEERFSIADSWIYYENSLFKFLDKDTSTLRGIVTNEVQLKDNTSGHYIDLLPATMASDMQFRFPEDEGTDGYILTTDGSGNTAWEENLAANGINWLGDWDGGSSIPATPGTLLLTLAKGNFTITSKDDGAYFNDWFVTIVNAAPSFSEDYGAKTITVSNLEAGGQIANLVTLINSNSAYWDATLNLDGTFKSSDFKAYGPTAGGADEVVGTSYDTFDAVHHEGSSYVSKEDDNEDEPPSAKWDMLAEKGDDGAAGAEGPAGPAGADGEDGEDGAQGPQGMTWIGAWNSGTTYNKDEAVSYGGSSWISLQSLNTNNTPADDAWWDIVALEGSDGAAGPQGPAGADGEDGEQGEQGERGYGYDSGGLIHQVAAKASATDYDFEWIDVELLAKSGVQVYISPTGDDTTGDGSSGNPYFTIAKAFQHLSVYTIFGGQSGVVYALPGIYEYTTQQTFSHKDGLAVSLEGTVNIYRDWTVDSVTGSSGDYDVVLQSATDVADIEEGYWLLVQFTSDTTYAHRSLRGAHEVTDVDSVNNQITIKVKSSLTTDPVVGSEIYASGIIAAVFDWSTCSERFKMNIPAYKQVKANNVVFNSGVPSSRFGFASFDVGCLFYSTGNVVFANWEVACWAQPTSAISIQNGGWSYCQTAMDGNTCTLGAFHAQMNGCALGLNLFNSDFSVNESAFCGNPGTALLAQQSRGFSRGTIYVGNSTGIRAIKGSMVDCEGTLFFDNNKGAESENLSYVNDAICTFDSNSTDTAYQIYTDTTHDHSGGDGATIDHGSLGDLGSDDHTQYHNDTRGATWHATLEGVHVKGKTPSSASDTGTAGEVCWDSGYIYVCVATDTWKRIAIDTWT